MRIKVKFGREKKKQDLTTYFLYEALLKYKEKDKLNKDGKVYAVQTLNIQILQ